MYHIHYYYTGGHNTSAYLSDTATTSTLFHPALYSQTLNTVCPSAEVLESDRIYLLDDRSTMYLYIGRNVAPQVGIVHII